MSEIPTQQDSQPDAIAGSDSARPGGASDRHRRARGFATYYRLRSIVLEARVRALETRLEERERQLEATVTRYEELLQRHDEDWVVTTGHGPDVEPAEE